MNKLGVGFVLSVALGVSAFVACKPKDNEEKETAGYVKLDVQSFCPLFIECASDGGTRPDSGYTSPECEKDLGNIAAPPTCNENFKSATCANFGASFRECFPACTYTEPKCDGDNSLQCISGREFTARCEDVCSAKGSKYVGECSKEYLGEKADKPVCWCRK